MTNKKEKKITKERLIEMIKEARIRQERKEQLDKSINLEIENEKAKFLFG